MMTARLNMLIATFAIAATTCAAECTRDGLFSAARSYLTAQIAGNPSTLSLAPNFTYQQNNKISPIASSLLSTPYQIALNRSTAGKKLQSCV